MSSTPRIVFVTEAGPKVGWGHLMRCLALARAAGGDRAGHFFLLEEDASALKRARSAGLDALPLPWRSAPFRALERIRTLAMGADVAVVDSYAVEPQFLADLRRAVGRLAVVDDTADRALSADVIVNGGLGAQLLHYGAKGATRHLLGPKYALLDPEFADHPKRDVTDRVARVLVTLGGGRPGDALRLAIEAVDRAFAPCRIDVAVGASTPDLERTCCSARNDVAIHSGQHGLRDLMLQADLAVAGAGVTLLELAACATPTVLVRMADNQQLNVDESQRHGLALSAGAAGDRDLGQRIEMALRQLAADAGRRQEMGARGRALVDGRGASRVVDALAEAAVAGR